MLHSISQCCAFLPLAGESCASAPREGKHYMLFSNETIKMQDNTREKVGWRLNGKRVRLWWEGCWLRWPDRRKNLHLQHISVSFKNMFLTWRHLRVSNEHERRFHCISCPKLRQKSQRNIILLKSKFSEKLLIPYFIPIVFFPPILFG